MTSAPLLPPLVLLHGFPFDHTLWTEVRRLLPIERRVLAPDLPGFGSTPPLEGLVSMDALADWLAGWLDEQAVASAVIAGHSMGGYVALAFAARYPARVTGLALVHSTAASDSPEKRANRDEQLTFIEHHGTARLAPRLINPLVAPDNADSLRATLDHFIGQATALPPAILAGCIAALRDRPDRRELLATLPVPILWVVGRQDPTLDPDAIRQQATEAPTALSIWLPGCGHLGMLEKPAAVAAALTHLARVT